MHHNTYFHNLTMSYKNYVQQLLKICEFCTFLHFWRKKQTHRSFFYYCRIRHFKILQFLILELKSENHKKCILPAMEYGSWLHIS